VSFEDGRVGRLFPSANFPYQTREQPALTLDATRRLLAPVAYHSFWGS
jgi:hypothetical protein